MPKVKGGGIQSPRGDVGMKRIETLSRSIGGFKRPGKAQKGSSYFSAGKPRMSKEGNNPS